MIITCEHGGAIVPELYKAIFSGHDELLQSHRGWDKGALDVATFLAEELDVPFYYTDITRLLIEANRSLTNEQLYSDITRSLPERDREEILRSYYVPYRSRVEEKLRELRRPVKHFSIHSFTPVWFEEIRKTDIGILFDPTRSGESAVAANLLRLLNKYLPELQIDLNEPYKGTDDGFTTHLRSLFPNQEYSGIEIEINQRFVETAQWEGIKHSLRDALKQL